MLTESRYLPAIGRFLIVVTFLEDAVRIFTQWNDQLLYLHEYRHCMSSRLQASTLNIAKLTIMHESPSRLKPSVSHSQRYCDDRLFDNGHPP